MRPRCWLGLALPFSALTLTLWWQLGHQAHKDPFHECTYTKQVEWEIKLPFDCSNIVPDIT